MHNDDPPVGRFLTRREVVALFGASVTAAAMARTAAQVPGSTGHSVAQSAAPDCVAQPEQTEGPYFVEERLERSDIRVDPTTGLTREGAPLALRFELSRVLPGGTCAVLTGAQVDIWHCDAEGIYSGVRDRSFNTTGQKFLRGYQVSDANGLVTFTTIYPGWYQGRAVHIHFKIRVPATGGRTDEFTSQLYFSDALTDRVHARPPYSAKKGQRLLNERDMIFREGGTQLVLPVAEKSGTYAATYRIAMQPGQSRQDRAGRGGRRSG
jgi:protocatechuate 3,4-dioxygenase beta subunit